MQCSNAFNFKTAISTLTHHSLITNQCLMDTTRHFQKQGRTQINVKVPLHHVLHITWTMPPLNLPTRPCAYYVPQSSSICNSMTKIGNVTFLQSVGWANITKLSFAPKFTKVYDLLTESLPSVVKNTYVTSIDHHHHHHRIFIFHRSIIVTSTKDTEIVNI